MPKVSVIIVCYNGEKTIARAIESCLSQSYVDMEIIIGDDGSSDGSVEIIKAYEKSYPEKIRHYVREHSGGGCIPSIRVSDNIKEALALAAGEYIQMLASDDYLCDDGKLSEAVRVLDADHGKKYSCVVSDYKFVFPGGNEVARRVFPIKAFYSWASTFLHVSCCVFRREVYERHFLLERFCDDIGMTFSLSMMGEFFYTQKVSFAYVRNENSIMASSSSVELARMEMMCFEDIGKKLEEKEIRMSLPARGVMFFRKSCPRYEMYKHNKDSRRVIYFLASYGFRACVSLCQKVLASTVIYSLERLIWRMRFRLEKIHS